MISILQSHPELAAQYSQQNQIPVEKISAGSGKVVLWHCSRGHIWEKVVFMRIRAKRVKKCPFCSNKKACLDNCLATLNPELIPEWHEKNTITPFDLVPGSGKKVWWKCIKEHEWLAEVRARTTKEHGCPYCDNNKPCIDNCLATIHPLIAKEWHPTKNGDLTPNDVVSGSAKKVWWLCSKGHECHSRVTNRAKENKGCRICGDERKSLKMSSKMISGVYRGSKKSKQYYSKKNDKTYSYRSPYEGDAFDILEKDDNVVSYIYEPFKIPYQLNGKNKNYVVDLLINRKDGKRVMIEIKPCTLIKKPENHAKTIAGIKYGKENGIKYLVWTEKHIYGSRSNMEKIYRQRKKNLELR